ncbi:MAG: DEAD/DEAH box helicase [Candidatus Thorarchaeota archaeon]
MPAIRIEENELDDLRKNLRSLGNRYAIEILQILSPASGDIIPEMGWDEIVDGILSTMGHERPKPVPKGERSAEKVKFDRVRQKFSAGGTLYESMNKLVKAGYVQALGSKGKKQRTFMITHEGRLALSAMDGMIGPSSRDTDLFKTAKLLLRHKNYIRLLPTQDKFLNEIGNIEENIIIQMPPGSGKTFLAMVAVLMNLQKGMKCLYLSPYLSLNTQIINEYGELLRDLGYSVVRHDGSQQVTVNELEEADLVVGVYEAVFSDVLQGEKWTSRVKLAIIDELTELDSPIKDASASNLGTDRSAKLDMLVTLLKSRSQVITLSSRFGDTESVAKWLNAKIFRPSVRLNPDEYIVTKEADGIQVASSDGTQKVILQKEYVLESVIEHLGDLEKKAILIVVSSRYQAVFFAGVLSRHWPRKVDPSLADYIVGQDRTLPVAGELYEFLKNGIAFHHAGLSSGVRRRLEEKIKSGEIKSVVSTTGITAGISFPFDCVTILFDRAMGFLSVRSRYLQIAGRIGEYHLAKHGGSVYLVFEYPSRVFQTVQELEETLLHKPLEPIRPGAIYPSILADLMIREMLKGKKFTLPELEKAVLQQVSESFRAIRYENYIDDIKKMYNTLFAWMIQKDSFNKEGNAYKLSKDTAAAGKSGLGIIRYLEIKDKLDALTQDVTDQELVEIALSFDMAQMVRPRTSYPTSIELSAAGLEVPDSWYDALTLGRMRVKGTALEIWISEMQMPEVLSIANEEGRDMVINNENIGTVEIEEGDLDSLISICGEVAMKLSTYFGLLNKRRISSRMEIFSAQLKYGVKADLGASDILELAIENELGYPEPISKDDARKLFTTGYKSISDILRKDIDPEKKSLARDRFAKNSGLGITHAKEIYKAALAHVRAKIERDDDED